MAISLSELVMGRDLKYPKDYTKQVQQNLQVLLLKINVIRTKYGKPMTVSSGWRPAELNAATPGAAKTSKHIVGLAVDIQDTDGELFKWCLLNLPLIQELGFYLEDKRYTKNWVHFGIGAPASGKRIFRPSSGPVPHPELWDGKYDSQFDKI